jgi:hypothetical protein
MASRTADELTGGMAHGCHIHCENYESISIKGLAPTSTFGRSLDLHLRSLDPTTCGGHALGTTQGAASQS